MQICIIMKYFKSFKGIQGSIYSVDMIRLNVDFGDLYENVLRVLQHLADFDLRYDIKYYFSSKPFTYKYLWNVSALADDVSFAIGLDLGRNALDRSCGYIEFNPNKLENSLDGSAVLHTLLNLCVSADVVRYDLAIDIPVSRNLCKLQKDGKKRYHMIVDSSLTEYLGARSKGGFVKLYDKTFESKLDYELTRLEITLERNQDIEKVFPVVIISDMQFNFLLNSSLSQNDQAVVSLLRSVPDPTFYLKQFTYRFRKKIEPFLSDTVLQLDKKAFLSAREIALSYEI